MNPHSTGNIPLIDYNYYCTNGFSEIEKSTIPYLQDLDIIFLGHERYSNNAEAQLVLGIMYSDDDIRNNLLSNYPVFLKTIQKHRENCYQGNNKDRWAISHLQRASNLGSTLAQDFLNCYKKKLGEEIYQQYIKY